MKLHEIKPLFENDQNQEFAVYKMSAPGVDDVYYGYNQYYQMKSNSDAALTKAVLSAARRMDDDGESARGTSRIVDLAGGEQNVNIQVVDVFDAEVDAFIRRNDMRRGDPNSITGPSHLPKRVMDEARASHPEISWKKPVEAAPMTAQEAIKANLLTPEEARAVSTAARIAAVRGGKASSPMLMDIYKNKITLDAFRKKYFSK